VDSDEFLRRTGLETYYPVLLRRLISQLERFSYQYVPLPEYEQLAGDISETMRVYWFEILERAHCDSMLALLRLERWLEAMRLSAEAPNFLGFAASFRGLLESTADVRHALGDVPGGLAAAFPHAYEAVHGQARTLVLAPDLENDLIHFSHARKLEKDERAPEAHAAKHMKAYLTSLQGASSGPLHDTYAELCNITHPAADSVLYLLTKRPDRRIVFAEAADEEQVQELLSRVGSVVTFCVSQSITYPAVILRIVNRFDLPAFRTPAVDEVSFELVPLWSTVSSHLVPPS
jgi:hypothetical protein